MRLDPAGREYATWTLTDAPEDLNLEVSVDGATWHPLARDGDKARVLVAGPDATGNPAGTLVLHLGRTLTQVRAVDHPEILIRQAGVITVTDG